MSWEILTALSTFAYAILFSVALWFAYIQTRGFEKNRKLQTAFVAFKELQTKEVRESRRYIYQEVPQEIEGLSDNELQNHLANSEEAIIAFEIMGYSLLRGHLDLEPVVSHY